MGIFDRDDCESESKIDYDTGWFHRYDEDTPSVNSNSCTRKSEEDYDPTIIQRLERDIGLLDSKISELDKMMSAIDRNLAEVVKVLDKFMKKLEKPNCGNF
jgi:hypothetical protein